MLSRRGGLRTLDTAPQHFVPVQERWCNLITSASVFQLDVAFLCTSPYCKTTCTSVPHGEVQALCVNLLW